MGAARGFDRWVKKGLRDRNSPTCTLSQNGYGASNSALYSLRLPHTWLHVWGLRVAVRLEELHASPGLRILLRERDDTD